MSVLFSKRLVFSPGMKIDNLNSQLAQIPTQIIEKTSYGVYTGLGVTQQATPNMTVKVATGTIYMVNGTRWTPAANNALAVTDADATNPRIDIVYVNLSGVISYLAGTPASTPSQPSTPAGGQLLATILVTAGKTSILTADISDRRSLIGLETSWITPTLINGWSGTCKIKRLANGSIWVVCNMSGVSGAGAFTFPIGWVTGSSFYTALGNNSGLVRILINYDFVPLSTTVVGSVVIFPL